MREFLAWGFFFFFFNDTATTEIYTYWHTLSLHDALPIYGPGSRLLIVTLSITVLRARPATKPVRPARAPFESPRISIGAFTAPEVIFTMRPKRRSIMPSTVAMISSIGVSMLAHTIGRASCRAGGCQYV